MKDVKKKKKEFSAVSVGEAPPGGRDRHGETEPSTASGQTNLSPVSTEREASPGGKFPGHVNNSTPTP